MRTRLLSSGPLFAVAVGALVVGLAAPAAAREASHLVNGRSIVKHSVAGNRLINNTVTGAQIKESTLGTVPRATTATTATTAKTALTATTATSATTLVPLVWHNLTLENGWAAYGHSFDTPAYAVDAQGIVHLRGAMDGGPSGSVAFALPATIVSPDVEAWYPVAAGDGTVALMTVVDSSFCPLDGSAPAGTVASFTDLDGLTFPAS